MSSPVLPNLHEPAVFGFDDACISRSIKRLDPILAKVMAVKKDRTLSQKELEEMIKDFPEQPIRRPKKRQRKYYSGKKKRHTIKNPRSGKIMYVSKPAPGKRHDFTIYKGQKPLPRSLYVDTMGLIKDDRTLKFLSKNRKKEHSSKKHIIGRFLLLGSRWRIKSVK